mgnify:CR=1 FL=1
MDKGASVLAKLKTKSKQTGNSLQMHLQLFCQEEFLRRLALSKYADNLVLKGGLFIYTLTNFESRATVDVDFLLRQLPNSVEEMEKIITEILSVDTGNDFIEFTAGSFESISPQRKYTGVSCQIVGKIKNTRTPFSVDLGVGDIIVPKAEKRKIPVQLEDFSQPEISTYSLESTIAEKFDAILQRLEMTSRMKDFYDIYYLSKMFGFDGRKLQEAISETLQNRGTSYNRDSLNQIAGFVNDAEMVAKWKRALKDIKNPDLSFDEVVESIVNFLNPIWSKLVDEEEFFGEWINTEQKWLKR